MVEAALMSPIVAEIGQNLGPVGHSGPLWAGWGCPRRVLEPLWGSLGWSGSFFWALWGGPGVPWGRVLEPLLGSSGWSRSPTGAHRAKAGSKTSPHRAIGGGLLREFPNNNNIYKGIWSPPNTLTYLINKFLRSFGGASKNTMSKLSI